MRQTHNSRTIWEILNTPVFKVPRLHAGVMECYGLLGTGAGVGLLIGWVIWGTK